MSSRIIVISITLITIAVLQLWLEFSACASSSRIVLEDYKPSTRLAYYDSNGYFTDITDETWERQRAKAHKATMYTRPHRPELGVGDPKVWYTNNIQPYLNCPHSERIGGFNGNGHGDGAKWLCDPHRIAERYQQQNSMTAGGDKRDNAAFNRNNNVDKSNKKIDINDNSNISNSAVEPCIIYSIGSNGEYDFEDELKRRFNKACEIHVFDPGNFARMGDALRRNIHYHPWGITSSYDSEYNAKVRVYNTQNNQGSNIYKSIPDTLRELGHEGKMIEILKIDCEGCEWATYKDWINLNIRQILVEVHGLPLPFSRNKYYHKAMNASDFFDEFRKQNYAMFYKEHNTFDGTCVELAFIKMNPSFWL